MGKTAAQNAERKAHSLARKHGLRLNVRVSWCKLPSFERKLPVLRFSDFLQHLIDTGEIYSKLCGGFEGAELKAVLREYWERFGCLFPNHEVVLRIKAGLLPPDAVIPIQMHQDEGRGYCKCPFLLVNTQGVLGKPSRTVLSKFIKGKRTVGVNFEGSLKSRFLYVALPKALYKQPRDFHAIFDTYKADLEPLVNEGFMVDDQRYFIALQSCKGDLPANIALGKLTRTFRHLPKKLHAPPEGSRSKPPNGICWRCSAGQTDYPFEDNSKSARWLETIGVSPGFSGEPCSLLQLGHDRSDPGSFFAFDIWHCDAQGDSQGFWGSCAVLVMDVLGGSSVDSKLDALNADILANVRKSERPHCLPITKAKMNWDTLANFPTLAWSKGSDAKTLNAWLEGFLDRYEKSFGDFPDLEPMLRSMHKAIRAKNFLMRSLYESPLWIERSVALDIAQAGFTYLKEQRRLVSLSHRAGRHLFMWQPKTHYLGHIIHSLFRGASECEFALNPLVDSVQMDEDFVGRPSRLSRRVTPKHFIGSLRTIERYLILAHEVWYPNA